LLGSAGQPSACSRPASRSLLPSNSMASSSEERLVSLRQQADSLRKQADHHEQQAAAFEEARKTVVQLELETKQADEQLGALKRKIAAESKKNDDSSGSSKLQPKAATAQPDTEQMGRIVMQLKARKAFLGRLKKVVDDPSATLKAEDSLADAKQELAKLQKDQIAQSRELRLLSKQCEEARSQYEYERVWAQETAEQEGELESYITRLRQLERTNGQLSEKCLETKQKCEGEWNAWFEMLCTCAKTLQAKLDGGDELMARLGQGWDATTPAANVLETTHRLLTECSALKTHQRDCEGKEEALKDKLARAQQRIDLLLLAKQKEAAGAAVGATLGGTVGDATKAAAPGKQPPGERKDVLASHLVQEALTPPE